MPEAEVIVPNASNVPPAEIIVLNAPMEITPPVQTRQSLLKELTRVYKELSGLRPPRAHEGGISVSQMRNWNCKIDYMKARIYCLTSMYPVLREEELATLTAQVKEIQEAIENARY